MTPDTDKVQAANLTQPASEIAAPAYDPSRPKLASADALADFELAMQAYTKKDYGKASVLLREASMRSPDAPEVRFFLGISYLMTKDTNAAISELKIASALSKNAYLEDSLYYLGEAYARKKDAINASRELDRVIAMRGRRANQAQTLREVVNVSAR